MGIKLKRYPEYGVTFLVFSGRLGVGDVDELCQALDARDCGKWLSYFDPTVDVSGVDLGRMPELKRAMAAKQIELCGGVHRLNAIVFTSGAGEEFVNFWQRYTLAGDVRPMTPAVFADMRVACDWLELPEAAGCIFEAEVHFPELGHPGDSSRLERPLGGVDCKPTV